MVWPIRLNLVFDQVIEVGCIMFLLTAKHFMIVTTAVLYCEYIPPQYTDVLIIICLQWSYSMQAIVYNCMCM